MEWPSLNFGYVLGLMSENKPPKPEGMSLGDHLDELRTRLFKGVVVICLCMVVAWTFRDQVYQVFLQPFETGVAMLRADWVGVIDQRLVDNPELPRTDFYFTADPADERLLPKYEVSSKPMVTAIGEGFMTKLKVCLYFSMFVGGPFLLWQLWAFIAAGLYKAEKRAVLSFFPTSIALFFSGILFGYFVLVPYGMYYLSGELTPDEGWIGFKLETYFTFISSLCLALGVIFQLPLLMMALARVGLVEPKTYARYRGHFVLAAFVIGAILTPPDPVTQSMMAGPMVILYEIGIWASRMWTPKPTDLSAEGA